MAATEISEDSGDEYPPLSYAEAKSMKVAQLRDEMRKRGLLKKDNESKKKMLNQIRFYQGRAGKKRKIEDEAQESVSTAPPAKKRKLNDSKAEAVDKNPNDTDSKESKKQKHSDPTDSTTDTVEAENAVELPKEPEPESESVEDDDIDMQPVRALVDALVEAKPVDNGPIVAVQVPVQAIQAVQAVQPQIETVVPEKSSSPKDHDVDMDVADKQVVPEPAEPLVITEALSDAVADAVSSEVVVEEKVEDIPSDFPSDIAPEPVVENKVEIELDAEAQPQSEPLGDSIESVLFHSEIEEMDPVPSNTEVPNTEVPEVQIAENAVSQHLAPPVMDSEATESTSPDLTKPSESHQNAVDTAIIIDDDDDEDIDMNPVQNKQISKVPPMEPVSPQTASSQIVSESVFSSAPKETAITAVIAATEPINLCDDMDDPDPSPFTTSFSNMNGNSGSNGNIHGNVVSNNVTENVIENHIEIEVESPFTSKLEMDIDESAVITEQQPPQQEVPALSNGVAQIMKDHIASKQMDQMVHSNKMEAVPMGMSGNVKEESVKENVNTDNAQKGVVTQITI